MKCQTFATGDNGGNGGLNQNSVTSVISCSKLMSLIFACMLTACTNDIAGLNRSQRMIIYGDVLELAGHPEIGEPLRVLAKTFAKNPVKNVNPSQRAGVPALPSNP